MTALKCQVEQRLGVDTRVEHSHWSNWCRHQSGALSLHTGLRGGTNSNLIFMSTDNVMLDFPMPAYCRLLGNVVIFPIGGVKVVFLDISSFGHCKALRMTDKDGKYLDTLLCG